MNNIDQLLKFHRSVWRYRNHIERITVRPMGFHYGTMNFNTKVTIHGNESIRHYFSKIHAHLFNYLCINEKDNVKPLDIRLKIVIENFQFISTEYKGAYFMPNNDYYSYLQTAVFLRDWINHFYHTKIKNGVEKKGIDFIIYDDKGKEVPKWFKPQNISLESIKEHVINFDASLKRTTKKIQLFLYECDNAYTKTIIGKIMAGTALTRKEIERKPLVVDFFKELTKLKSVMKESNEFIEKVEFLKH